MDEIDHMILQTAAVPLVHISGVGNVVAFNKMASDILGETIRGRHFSGFFRGPDAINQIESTFRDRKSRHVGLEKNVSGRSTIFHVTIAPLGEQDLLLTLLDVTAEHAASRSRSDFVANVSHELRTPLTAISGIIETLQLGAVDDLEARTMFLDMMFRETARMNRLVGDLLSLSRVENSLQRNLQDFDICKLVSEAASTLVDVAADTDVTIRVEGCEDDVMLHGDSDQLKQVFLNLLENAIKYGNHNSEVCVTVSKPQSHPLLGGKGVRIDVSDKGEGIAPEHIARLTERFYRVDTHRSREAGGTGLGLAIVKHILNGHGGRLRIQSVQGKGSVFSVYLPVSQGNLPDFN